VALFALVPATEPVRWPAAAAFIALQPVRIWIIASLGGRWTTRILVPPERPPVRTGPYRWMRHPNYALVSAEIALLPLAFGAWTVALVFSVLNGALLAHRIRVENAAWRDFAGNGNFSGELPRSRQNESI
jgi:methyltransferase